MTLAELAEKVGYKSTNAVWRVENGHVDLPVSKLEKFAKILGVSVEELLLCEALDAESKRSEARRNEQKQGN